MTRAPLPPVISPMRASRSSSPVTMTCAAPPAMRASRLAAVRVVATGVAPTRLAIWIAARPTLLDAPG
jgi:hypothetical protein